MNDSFGIGKAVKELQDGKRVQRAGWNGKGMWLTYISEGVATLSDGTEFSALPYIAMKTADNKLVPWLASQTDILAIDWSVCQ